MHKYHTQPLASELFEAYHNTDYCFTAQDQEFIIRLSDENAAFASFLEVNKIMDWAFITAWNPYSISMPDAYNIEQQQMLLSRLESFRTWEGEGRGRDGCWKPEASYFVAGISKDTAIALGQEFGQNAILIGGADGKANLIKLFDSFRYRFSNGRLVVDGCKKRHTHYLDNLEINPIRLGRGKDLINSEGSILSLHRYNDNLYLSSFLKDGSGRVYYATNKELIQDFMEGKFTTNQLLEKSPSREFSIKHSSRSVYARVSSVLKTEFNQEVQCGNSLFTELHQDMVTEQPYNLFS